MSSTTYGSRGSATRTTARLGGLGFDLVVAVLSALFMSGLYLDGWAHFHRPGTESFFTPWHAVFYAGFLAVAIAIGSVIVLNHRSGLSWWSAIPAGYGLSLLGVAVFALGGVGDVLWHELVGLEQDVEALLSPTHLLIGIGMALIVSGPLRAAWRRTGIPSLWQTHLAMLLSLALLLSLFTFFTQYANLFGTTLPAVRFQPDASASAGNQRMAHIEQALGVVGIVLHTGLLMGLLLPVLRRWTLPLGAITLILTLNIALMTLMRGRYVATGALPLIGFALLTGIASDLLCRSLRPASAATRNFRIVAFAIPVLLYGLYFAALNLFGGGLWWTTPLWTGSIVVAGLIGWLMSFALVPTATSEGPKFR